MNDASAQPRALCSRYTQYWPRRLLHIPSMRSLEREQSNTYGESSQPSYATVSYTWGRFEISDGPALFIDGIPWTIPAIDPYHFRVEEFENTIRSIAQISGCEFLWLDVACANFSNRSAAPTRDNEISLQREIFLSAAHNFIWLSETSFSSLSNAFADVSRVVNGVDCKTGLAVGFADIDQKLQDVVVPAFRLLLGDPWFSSLWTLQEAMVNPDAVLLSANGSGVPVSFLDRYVPGRERYIKLELEDNEHVQHKVQFDALASCKGGTGKDFPNSNYLTLRHLVRLSQLLLDLVSCRLRQCSRTVRRDLEKLANTIVRSGLPAFATFNLLRLWKISQKRRELQPGDRLEYIYKYVFRFPAGRRTPFADPNASKSQREAYFHGQLMLHFPVLSQLFSRLKTCETGLSWRLDQGCEFPDLDLFFTCFRDYTPQITTKFVITEDEWHRIHIKGTAYNFSNAMKLLLGKSLVPSTSRLLGISFDCTTINLRYNVSPISIPSMVVLPTLEPKLRTTWRVPQEELAQNINIFTDLLQQNRSGAVARVLVLARAPGIGEGPGLAIGLIIVKEQQSEEKVWRRVGFCFWVYEMQSAVEYGMESIKALVVEGILA